MGHRPSMGRPLHSLSIPGTLCLILLQPLHEQSVCMTYCTCTVHVMKKFPVFPVPFRSVAVSFLFRFLSFPFSELRIMSALALSRTSDRCSHDGVH